MLNLIKFLKNPRKLATLAIVLAVCALVFSLIPLLPSAPATPSAPSETGRKFGIAGDNVWQGDNWTENRVPVIDSQGELSGLDNGTSGQVLTSSGSGAAPTWGSSIENATWADNATWASDADHAATADAAVTSSQIVWATLSSDHSYGGITESGTIGETLAFGELCYYKSDGKWWLTDSDASSTTDGILAICVVGGNADATGSFLTLGYVRDDSWAWGTVGGALYVDVTAGDMSHTAPSGSGDQVRRVGFAKTADIVYFTPDTMIIELT